VAAHAVPFAILVADDMLTARELEVLVHVAGGNANKITPLTSPFRKTP
jgi:hypothetical protein